ncbi:MAG: sigma 54-interacting transcriptional regulator [Polyangiales bacterium]
MTHDDSTVETSRALTRAPSLRVMNGGAPRAFALRPDVDQVVGRAEGCDVRVPDASLSRRHAILRVGEAITVEDLDSANGTRVRGQRVPPRVAVELLPGEVFELGALLCVVESGAARAHDRGGPVVVADPAMVELHALVDRVAPGAINVLLLGETGVGKEVFAEAVHRRSHRARGPFVKINCAAFTETLIESELFGHEKGAFTGASAARAGILESAEGGTVFLDEVGELPPVVQAKLLRVLEERAVRRVGAVRAKPFDARIVSATNRDLEAEVAAGRFRADLFFRLNGFTLLIPPLRARRGEIEPLARRFVADAAARNGTPEPALTREALDALRAHAWPGNIRELRNVIERAVLLAGGAPLLPSHLPLGRPAGSSPGVPAAPSAAASLKEAVVSAERQRILDALAQAGGNQTRAAELLGIGRRTLIDKLELYNLPRPRKGRDPEG